MAVIDSLNWKFGPVQKLDTLWTGPKKGGLYALPFTYSEEEAIKAT